MSVKFGGMREVTLTGQVFAAHEDGRPVLLDLPMLGPSFALFRTADELRFYMEVIGIVEYRIKQVRDGEEFMRSEIPYPIVCDMRYEGGKSKWALVKPINEA